MYRYAQPGNGHKHDSHSQEKRILRKKNSSEQFNIGDSEHQDQFGKSYGNMEIYDYNEQQFPQKKHNNQNQAVSFSYQNHQGNQDEEYHSSEKENYHYQHQQAQPPIPKHTPVNYYQSAPMNNMPVNYQAGPVQNMPANYNDQVHQRHTDSPSKIIVSKPGNQGSVIGPILAKKQKIDMQNVVYHDCYNQDEL